MEKHKTIKAPTSRDKQHPSPQKSSALAVARGGVSTANDFARLMSALMGDVLEGNITPDVANSSCAAGRNLLKVIEMQHKYGNPLSRGGKGLVLVS